MKIDSSLGRPRNVAEWLAVSKRGDVYAYHRTADHCGRQVSEFRAVKPADRNATEHAVCAEASAAWDAHTGGLVRLVQARHGGDFIYQAIRR